MKHTPQFIRSVHNAWRGMQLAIKERNFKILAVIACMTLGVSVALPLKEWEMITVLMLITLVLVLEILNSVFERLADMVEPKIHHYVKEIKDLMAGAVLLASIVALAVGIIIFFPYLRG